MSWGGVSYGLSSELNRLAVVLQLTSEVQKLLWHGLRGDGCPCYLPGWGVDVCWGRAARMANGERDSGQRPL